MQTLALVPHLAKATPESICNRPHTQTCHMRVLGPYALSSTESIHAGWPGEPGLAFWGLSQPMAHLVLSSCCLQRHLLRGKAH